MRIGPPRSPRSVLRAQLPSISLGLTALCLLGGCKLIDQNTFAPAPEAKTAPATVAMSPTFTPVPVLADSRRALVTIDYAGPEPSYQQMLRYAVHAAEARDGRVQYDVIAVVPSAEAAGAGQRDASGVMRAIMANGVPPGRIHLGLSVQPGLASSQVRVYVR